MRAFRSSLLLVILSFVFSSFHGSRSIDHSLLGFWSYSSYENNTFIYSKRRTFDDKQSGIWFRSQDRLVKRQNRSWCGTGPISYTNYDGQWSSLSDSTVTMTFAFWGGRIQTSWQIMDVSDSTLTFKVLEEKALRPLR